jgi:hypothetical protein
MIKTKKKERKKKEKKQSGTAQFFFSLVATPINTTITQLRYSPGGQRFFFISADTN